MKDSSPRALTIEDLRRGHEAYVKNEPRDAMYRVATLLVKQFWGNAPDMADSLGVLLLTWNSGFYRYGSLDFASLQKCIEKNLETLVSFRNRDITSLVEADEAKVKQLFRAFLLALRRPKHKKSPEAFSPVSAAKTLHVLVPSFFPLWDDEIAKKGYQCYWYTYDKGAAKYWEFMLQMKKIVVSLLAHPEEVNAISDRSILKLIDEYNYSRFSNNWLQ
jgi:hypothetical protein